LLRNVKKQPALYASAGLALSLSAVLLFAFAVLPALMMNDGFHYADTVNVYVDGKLVETVHNQIMSIAYDYMVCKAFNDTTACNVVGSYLPAPNYCFSGPSQSASKVSVWTFCNIKLGAIGLSSDSTTPQAGSSACPSLITSSGLTAAMATTSHTANTNTVVLTASWTASGSQTVSKVCLFPVSTYEPSPAASGTYSIITGPSNTAWAQTLLSSSVNLVSGQSLTVQWTFSF
jgi:hypothetical protein